MQAISSSAERVGWSGLGPAVALLICISNLGGVGAYLAALSRIPFVAGIDRFLPPAFARVHPKWGTPYVSLIVQSLCCVLLHRVGTTRQYRPWRLPGTGEHDHHHQFHSVLVHVCGDDSPATRAGRGRSGPGSRRKASCDCAGDCWLRDHLCGHSGLDGSRRERTTQGSRGSKDYRIDCGSGGRRRAAVFHWSPTSAIRSLKYVDSTLSCAAGWHLPSPTMSILK